MKNGLSKNSLGFIPHIEKLRAGLAPKKDNLSTGSVPRAKRKKLCGGFTLAELMVSIGLFSVVVLLATGAFIHSLRIERQSSAFMSVNSNLTTVLEQMAREIRTGSNFNSAAADSLSFTGSAGAAISYCLQSGAIMRNTGADCAFGQKVTADSVAIQYLTFIVSGNQSNDGWPPRVTILIGAKPANQSASAYTLNVQTTASSRGIDG